MDRQRTPLHLAVQAGHLELAQGLRAQGAEVDRPHRFGDTALSSVCRPPLPSHWVVAAELLIAHGADPTIKNRDDESALDSAQHNPVTWEQVRHLFAKYTQR